MSSILTGSTISPRARAAARWLFGTAAVFNLVVGLGILFFRAALAPVLAFDPVVGSNVALANLVGGFVALFGIAYVLAAFDPVRWRVLIQLSAAGKLIAFGCVVVPWLAGDIAVATALPAFVDLAYALLFLAFLARTRAPSEQFHA